MAEPLTPARALALLEQLSVTRAQVLDNGIVLLTFGPDPHRLEILDCAWRVQTSDAVVVGSTDGAGVRQEQVRRLAGAQVTATSVTGPFFDATVRFATVELRMFPFVVGAGDPYWRVRTPTDDTVACL